MQEPDKELKKLNDWWAVGFLGTASATIWSLVAFISFLQHGAKSLPMLLLAVIFILGGATLWGCCEIKIRKRERAEEKEPRSGPL